MRRYPQEFFGEKGDIMHGPPPGLFVEFHYLQIFPARFAASSLESSPAW